MKIADKLYILLRSMMFPYDEEIDVALERLMSMPNLEFREDQYMLYIFSNGELISFLWNRNKWYAWLSWGKVCNYHWRDSRPSRKMMVKFYDWLEKKI